MIIHTLSRSLVCFPPLAAAYDSAQYFRPSLFTLLKMHDAIHTDAGRKTVPSDVANLARVY